MNVSTFKKSFFILFLFICPIGLSAQEQTDSVYIRSRYERRIEAYTYLWDALIPKYTKIQFAGSMGMFSFGGGWNYGKNHWETDLLLGFVPKQTSNVHSDRALSELNPLITFTLKQNYIPWHIPVNENITFEPLSCGIYFNTLLNGNFWSKQPSKYPEGYYFFSTKIRTLLFLGERVTFKLNHKYKHNKSITLFYEISTCDLYLLCAVQNAYLKPKDYLSLSLGVKLQIL
ncbi:hypothetical protein D0T51_02955 [Parabacteroides sp. 52]|uniref:hypothetical protein n=1 Tax=unclassified Parabacteroides TaxID=2649774 RepID=UPI0013D16353|nr:MULTISPECIES: hypothetical protein [unclassified Parabacteroides]MDH6533949.1 hypothetical protein [Parabacteroides sp. PM5-20]NDV54693.1 hypothetical protein [Parabacteroides sp. 52]